MAPVVLAVPDAEDVRVPDADDDDAVVVALGPDDVACVLADVAGVAAVVDVLDAAADVVAVALDALAGASPLDPFAGIPCSCDPSSASSFADLFFVLILALIIAFDLVLILVASARTFPGLRGGVTGGVAMEYVSGCGGSAAAALVLVLAGSDTAVACGTQGVVPTDPDSSIFSSSGAAAAPSTPSDCSNTALFMRSSALANFSTPASRNTSSNRILHAGVCAWPPVECPGFPINMARHALQSGVGP